MHGRLLNNRIRVMLVCALVAGAAAPGCIFETREPIPPGSGSSSWLTPDFPDKIFANLKSGLEELDGENYNRSLNDIFTFVPLPDDVDQFPAGTYGNWTAEVEKTVVQGIVSDASAISVAFDNLTQTISQGQNAQFESDYTLTVTNAISGVETFKGKARLDMLNGSKGWELIRWEDIERVSGFATWGFLRGRIRQQQGG